MQNSDLIRMANQMATFFKAYGPEEAKKEIATHLNNFWDPSMRKQFLAYVETGGKDVDALVISAMPLVRKPAA